MKNAMACAALWMGLIVSCSDEGVPPPIPMPPWDYDPCEDPRTPELRTQAELDAYLDCGHDRPNLIIRGSVDSLERLRGMTALGTFRIEGTSLTSLDALENVISIGSVELNDTSLSSVELPVLREAQSITVDGNSNLTSVSFPALTSGGATYFKRNRVLTAISMPMLGVFNDPESMVLVLRDNPALSTVDFSSVEKVAVLDILGCGLADLSGFTGLTTITGCIQGSHYGMGLRLHSNPKLVSLAGLENLTSVSQSIAIIANDELASLDGLSGLTPLGAMPEMERPFFSVSRNPKLPACLVEDFALRLGVECDCMECDCADNGLGAVCPD